MKPRKRLSFLLSLVMLLSLCAGCIPAYAEEPSVPDAGACIHHLEHDQTCGYTPSQEAQPCTHQHNESCGYQEATPEVPCDKGCTDTDGDGVIDHAPDCAYTPAVEGTPCTHQHDESCGYQEAVEGTACEYARNGCPYCITAWEWVDPEGLLTQDNGAWGLGLAGVTQDNPLTREALTQMLPSQITAIPQNGESVTLDLVWDLSSLPEEGATSGDYTVTASLAQTPENYALATGTAPLEVTLQLGAPSFEAEDSSLVEENDGSSSSVGTYSSLPSGEPTASDYIVEGVSPNGTTIDLFDYWITEQTDSDITDSKDLLTSGINKNHALIFRANAPGGSGTWNSWTGTMAPRTGLVADHLVNGYPQLNVNTSTATNALIKACDGQESLAYLFDPHVSHAGKASYEDVQGLLQVDDDGYYYYDSRENYAVYYQDANAFTLYQYPGIVPGGSSPVGQFFPFNEAESKLTTINRGGVQYTLINSANSKTTAINHYFGIHMSTRFIQQEGGYTADSKPVTYEFSGDDDVWIFIDGKLVADLGGIHNASSVRINFATGKVYINDTNGNEQQDSGEVGYASYTLGEKLGLSSDTLPDNTYHTLDFFFLERGNVDSNMSLKYNLVTIPESDLIKMDQLGDPVEGAEFTLYSASEYQSQGTKATPIATGTTDSGGEFVFLKTDNYGNTLPISIQELYEGYGYQQDTNGNNLILVETKTPAGYRSVGEIGLYFYISPSDKEEVLLMSRSIWDKGAYAMPKVTVTTGNSIQLISNGTSQEPSQVDLVGPNAEPSPLMFAVVFQKQTDQNGNVSWLPVSGDPITGWKVQEDSSWGSILAAARDNPYLFQIVSSGAYQAVIDNLPGDITTYYHLTQNIDESQYTIGYYYTQADSLASATRENTWRINSEPKEEKYDLNRVFSVNLYVTNIKNRLLVQKVDEDGTPVNGAQFSLYKASDVTTSPDGTVSLKPNATPYDTLTTSHITTTLDLDGGGAFPTGGHVLEAGEYYLFETAAPMGYKPTEDVVHVVVDNTGVYADAGTTDDDITVLRGVGSVMRSMIQFAADDDVDTTLNAIQATLSPSVTFKGYLYDGSFEIASPSWDKKDILHLQYANHYEMLDYGIHGATTPGDVDSLTLETTAGWSKLLIQQCYQHDTNVDTSIKEDLRGNDITNLFSGTVTVRVSNDKTGNLKIYKVVTGEGAPSSQSFSFSVEVVDQGHSLSGTYKTVDSSGNYGSISFTQGKASVQLKAGESLTILSLPTGAEYTVTETLPPDRYTPSVSVSGDGSSQVLSPTAVTGFIQHNTSETEAVTVTYTNDFDGSQKLQLKGSKVLLGRDMTNQDSFTFTLSPGDEATSQAITAGNVVMPSSTTATVTGNGTSGPIPFTFGEILFKTEGTYVFHIAEDPGNDQGLVYDSHTAVVTVVVTRDPNTGILSPHPSYSNAGAPTDADENTAAVFTNQQKRLVLEKVVSGTLGDRDKEFTFNVTMQGLNGTYHYIGGTISGYQVDAPSDGTITFQNGSATEPLKLKHGQTITLLGLPAGTEYTIEETNAQSDGYTARVSVDGGSLTESFTAQGKLPAIDTGLVHFENQKDGSTSTGIRMEEIPWVLALETVLLGSTGWYLIHTLRRRAKERGGHL